MGEVKRQFPVGKYKCAQVLRTQFPLRPAAAKTAHRCQGDTMLSAVVDFQGRTDCHSHYVALSGVTSLQNLHILDLNEQRIRVSHEVKAEIERLINHRMLTSPMRCPKNSANEKFSLLFHNVRSFHAHMIDIKHDPNFTSANVNKFLSLQRQEFTLPMLLSILISQDIHFTDMMRLQQIKHRQQKQEEEKKAQEAKG